MPKIQPYNPNYNVAPTISSQIKWPRAERYALESILL